MKKDQENNDTQKMTPRFSSSITNNFIPYSLVGEQLLDFKIVDVLGEGGMGVVYKAKQMSLDRYVALKLLLQRNENYKLDQIKEEARLVAKMQHPNIISVHLLGEDRDRFFFVMDFFEGKTLEELIQERKKAKKHFQVDEILNIITQVVQGLWYAHQKGVIHRDIKPANIMVNEEVFCKVMDFGLAKLSYFSTSDSGYIVGTPAYMSPEQIAGREIGPKSDLFSVGILFYELLTGKKPFEGENLQQLFHSIQENNPIFPSKFNFGISSDIDSVVRLLLEKNPEDRYESADELIKDLENLKNRAKTNAFNRYRKKGGSLFQKFKINGNTFLLRKMWKIFIVLFLIGALLTTFFLFFTGKSEKRNIFVKNSKKMDRQRELELAKNYILIKRRDLAIPILRNILETEPELNYRDKAEKLLQQAEAVTSN